MEGSPGTQSSSAIPGTISPELLERYLGDEELAQQFLRTLGTADAHRAYTNLVSLWRYGVPTDLLAEICQQLQEYLPRCADADMALNNLERFFARVRNPLSLAALFQRDPEALRTLIQVFSASQHLSDLLTLDPEAFELVRLSQGTSYRREVLVDELVAEIEALEHEQDVLRALRRFKRRETLRIAYGDIVCHLPVQMVTRQISYVADAILEGAFRAAWRKLVQLWGSPRLPNGEVARFVILAMGKLGGLELNYSSDIDLVFLYEDEGHCDGPRSPSNHEFFQRLATEIIRFVTEPTDLGVAYRVDMRLRPEGRHGPLAVSIPAALRYYDMRGRTWERQAYIKARPAAGSLELGQRFLEQMESWIYRRYLSQADIIGIKALKRRIEQQTQQAGGETTNVKTGRGGIRDIEFVIQFLQLLHGPELRAVRSGNTLEAIAQLASAGCLTEQERALLAGNYCFLRKLEHRLQIMFDLQTHSLPSEPEGLRKLAIRMGFADKEGQTAKDAFEAEYSRRTTQNQRILHHLLHHAFPDDAETEAEVNLVLDPDPPQERIELVLGKYGFRNISEAYRNLMALAEERASFLSTRRARLFLASIAPQLLRAVSETPDPDATLVNLETVSGSLGGRGLLWELFSFNPPSLRLFVELCAYSPYLCGLLTSNPGMIDSLMDSLVLDKLPSPQWLRDTLTELCRAAEDLDPILHSFKNDQLLRAGVRDLLGKEDIVACMRTLSNVALVCLEQICAHEYHRLLEKFGDPMAGESSSSDQRAELIILALGKFGGAELTYRSDLDIVFLYDCDGQTIPRDYLSRATSTTNQHFFSELAQRIIRRTSRLSAYGRLYEIDARLRPTGKSGPLVTSIQKFLDYYTKGEGQLWERLALCRARPVVASARMAERMHQVIREAAFCRPWQPKDLREISAMRQRLEEAAGNENLKRGPGGMVDIEFVVQALQLRHGPEDPEVHVPHTIEALQCLEKRGYMPAEDAQFFRESYRFLRTLESRVRLVNPTARNRLPIDPTELARVAHLLDLPSVNSLMVRYEMYTRENRHRFQRYFNL